MPFLKHVWCTGKQSFKTYDHKKEYISYYFSKICALDSSASIKEFLIQKQLFLFLRSIYYFQKVFEAQGIRISKHMMFVEYISYYFWEKAQICALDSSASIKEFLIQKQLFSFFLKIFCAFRTQLPFATDAQIFGIRKRQ